MRWDLPSNDAEKSSNIPRSSYAGISLVSIAWPTLPTSELNAVYRLVAQLGAALDYVVGITGPPRGVTVVVSLTSGIETVNGRTVLPPLAPAAEIAIAPSKK